MPTGSRREGRRAVDIVGVTTPRIQLRRDGRRGLALEARPDGPPPHDIVEGRGYGAVGAVEGVRQRAPNRTRCRPLRQGHHGENVVNPRRGQLSPRRRLAEGGVPQRTSQRRHPVRERSRVPDIHDLAYRTAAMAPTAGAPTAPMAPRPPMPTGAYSGRRRRPRAPTLVRAGGTARTRRPASPGGGPAVGRGRRRPRDRVEPTPRRPTTAPATAASTAAPTVRPTR